MAEKKKETKEIEEKKDQKVQPKEKKEPKIDWLKLDGVPKSPEEFSGWMRDRVVKHPVVKAHHGKWEELIAWENGNQFSLWNTSKKEVLPVKLVTRKKQVIINLMKPLNETIEGKLNFYHHVVGIPNSGESIDIYGAEVATKLIDHNDYVINHEDIMEEAKYDLLRPGTTCKKWWWDESMYGTIAPKKKGKIDTDNKAEESGEVNCKVVPIFNVRPDPTAKRPKDMRWLIEIKECTRQEILDKFGKKENKYRVTNEILDEIKETYRTQRDTMYRIPDEQDDDSEAFILRELWERPSQYYENGRFIVTCANKVFHAGRNPNPKGKLGYFFYFFKKTPYSFWSKGPLHYIQDIQREFNRMISLISEHLEAWRPKMAVTKGGLSRARAMTIESFEIVEVNTMGEKPTPINMPEISGQVTLYRDFLIGSVDRVSNVHEVSYARLPQYASRAPASLYEMMLEQENVKLSPMVTRTNKTLVEEAVFRLELMDQHYDMPRLTKIIGSHRHATIQYYKNTDLNKNFDVRLEIGVSINQSATVQQRIMLELWREGILEGRDRMKILNMINFGTAEHEFRSDLQDSERAMRENQAYLDGKEDKLPIYQNYFEGQMIPLPIYKHDDHEVHMDYHTTLMKSDQFNEMSKETQMNLNLHIEFHHVLYSMALAAQAGQPPGGGPPGLGTPANQPTVPGKPGPLEEPFEQPTQGQISEPGAGPV